MGLNIDRSLALMAKIKASDLHFKVGTPPVVRRQRLLQFLESGAPAVTQEDLEGALSHILTDAQRKGLRTEQQIDFSYGVKGFGRFRFNVFYQRGTLRVVIRHIPHNIPTFESLNLPDKIKRLADAPIHGLILVTGSTGMGKSSTIVSMLDKINQTKNRHIITIEDPIEFLLQDKKSLITQRELGTDYISYASAMKSALRQDPDIIFFGELRDEQSVEVALNAANTGHLVFSSLHTNNVIETITRILAFFSDDKIKQKRMEFAACMRAIISQRLIERKSGKGFVPAVEVINNNPRVRKILEDSSKSPSVLMDVIESGKEVWGMQSFNQHILELYKQGIISQKAALKASDSPEKLQMHFSGLIHENRSANYAPKTSSTSGSKQALKLDLAVEPLPAAQPQKRRGRSSAAEGKKALWKGIF